MDEPSLADASTSHQKKSIFISAGEQSGEMHGAELIRELRAQCSGTELEINGLGGDLMKERGANILHHIQELAAVGLLEVATKYSYFRKVLRNCLKFVKNNPPEAVILIDYPGFNLKFAEELRKFYTGKIIYYISPQLWAWNEKRVYKIKKYVDKMLVVLPFEVEFYKRFGVDAEFVGHPLVRVIKNYLIEHKRKESGGETKNIVLLPGSRNREIRNHLPVLLKTARILEKEFRLVVKVSKASSVESRAFEPYAEDLKGYELSSESAYDLMLRADLVMVKCGTSTLECGLIGTPHMTFLRTAPINYYLLKPIVKIDTVDLLNIVAGENIIKEFIQNDFKPRALAEESLRILNDVAYREQMKTRMKVIWELLGDKDASYNAANTIKQIALS